MVEHFVKLASAWVSTVDEVVVVVLHFRYDHGDHVLLPPTHLQLKVLPHKRKLQNRRISHNKTNIITIIQTGVDIRGHLKSKHDVVCIVRFSVGRVQIDIIASTIPIPSCAFVSWPSNTCHAVQLLHVKRARSYKKTQHCIAIMNGF